MDRTPLCADAPTSPDWIDARVDTAAGAVPVRLYGAAPAPRQALVVHLHGGNFIAGSIDCGATVARLLARAGAVVVSAAYPPACRHPFLAALEAGRAVLEWASARRSALAGKGARLFVAGEEGGANLAAALAMQSRDLRHPPLAGQILISPMLDPRLGTASMRQRRAGQGGCQWAEGWHAYLDCGMAADHPYALPARALRLAGLPPALILTAEDDPLRDEAGTFARRLAEAGTPARCEVLPGITGWPCQLREPAAPAPWTDPVVRQLAGFLQPDNNTAALPGAAALQSASNPTGDTP
jgi:acetyl esterase/lipase